MGPSPVEVRVLFWAPARRNGVEKRFSACKEGGTCARINLKSVLNLPWFEFALGFGRLIF